jgi:hypothetical protein
MTKADLNTTPIPSRRAVLAAGPAVAAAALAGGTAANAVAIGMAKAGEIDPVFAAAERLRAALEEYDAAHAHFNAMDALYPRETEPDDFMDWTIEQRYAWQDAEIARREGGPRDIAYDRWNDQCEKLNEATEALIATIPTTAAGIAVALEHWSEFSDRISGDGEFDFLELDCGSRLLTVVAGALCNIIARGQA